MTIPMQSELLSTIQSPTDLRKLTVPELPKLAEEIRNAICEQVQKSGGHLTPNLGVVELMIALHYVFDFSHDRLLFDVGHQCYPHKLLTGRQHLLGKLRQRGGMSGFPSPDESTFDLFSSYICNLIIYSYMPYVLQTLLRTKKKKNTTKMKETF